MNAPPLMDISSLTLHYLTAGFVLGHSPHRLYLASMAVFSCFIESISNFLLCHSDIYGVKEFLSLIYFFESKFTLVVMLSHSIVLLGSENGSGPFPRCHDIGFDQDSWET